MEVRRRRTKTSSSSAAPQLLAKLDAFPKIDSEYTTKSRSGGGLAIFTFLFILFMVLLEIIYFMDTHMEYDYAVNSEVSPKIELNLDITVAMPCAMIDADVYDHLSQTPFSGESFPGNPVNFEMSEEQAKFHSILNKARKEKLGAGSTIEEILFKNAKALGSGVMNMPTFISDDSLSDGCRFNGTLTVNRHAGTLHVIMGKQINLGIGGNFHAHIQFGGTKPLNFSHRIDHLSFGSVKVPYFGSLDNELKISNEATQEYQYTITVVPVSIDSSKAQVHTYQLSVQEKQRVISHEHGAHGQPGIYFKYDFAPLKIIAKEKHKPLFDLLVRIVGIVGGSFSLSTFFFFIFDIVTCKVLSNKSKGIAATTSSGDKNDTASSNKGGTVQNGHNATSANIASPNALYIPTNTQASNYVYPIAAPTEGSQFNISNEKKK